METTCPHCSQSIGIDPETLESLRGLTHFECPACTEAVPVPPMPARRPVAPPVGRKTASPWAGAMAAQAAWEEAGKSQVESGRPVAAGTNRGLHRNLRILGAVVLLVLGGLGIFLATQKAGIIRNVRKEEVNEFINNKFFTDLIASGKTTRKVLEEMTGVTPWGIGYLGISKKGLTWEQARDAAARAAGEVLLIDLAGADSEMGRRPAAQTEALIRLLLEKYQQQQGSTVWVRDHTGEPRVIDIPDVNPVATLDRPRPVFVHWRPAPPKMEPVPQPVVRILSTDPPLSTDPAKPTVLWLGEDWVKVNIEYENPGIEGLNATAYPFTKGITTTGYGNNGLHPLPQGKGTLSECSFFLVNKPEGIDEVGVELYRIQPGQQEQNLGVAAVLPAYARWEINRQKWQIDLLTVKPPALFSPETKDIRIKAPTGQKFKLDLTVKYKTPVPTKLASNLLMKEMNILQSEFLRELEANHSTTWHFDTESRQGYQAVKGEGELTFDLTGYAPNLPGTYSFNLNLGLFDKRTWDTVLLQLYKVNLLVEGATVSGISVEPASQKPASTGPRKIAKKGGFEVSQDDTVLIERSDGSKAVVQLTSIGPENEATYKWRFRPTPSAAITAGTGRVFDDYERVKQPDGTIDVKSRNPDSTYIKAGSITMEWSAGGQKSSWFYLRDESEVTILRSSDYELRP